MSEHDLSHHMPSPIHVDYHTTPNLQLSERRFTDLVYSLSNIVFITGRSAPLLCGCRLCCQYCNPQRAVKHWSQQCWLHKWNCLSSVEWQGTVDFFLLPIRFGPRGETVITCATGKVTPIESLVTATTMGQNRDKLFWVQGSMHSNCTSLLVDKVHMCSSSHDCGTYWSDLVHILSRVIPPSPPLPRSFTAVLN